MTLSKGFIVAFGLTLSLLVIGLFLNFEMRSLVDFDIITDQLRNNQTFVEEQDCEKIKLTIRIAEQVWPDKPVEMIEEFQKLYVEKKCDMDLSWTGIQK